MGVLLKTHICTASGTRLHQFDRSSAGWGYQKRGIRKRAQAGTLCYSIPYSEHSSWPELRRCVKAFAPKKLIPTVNVGDKASFDRMVAKFADGMDLRDSKAHIDHYFISKRALGTGKLPQALNCAATPAKMTGSAQCLMAASPNTVGTEATFSCISQATDVDIRSGPCMKRTFRVPTYPAATKLPKMDCLSQAHGGNLQSNSCLSDIPADFDVCSENDLCM